MSENFDICSWSMQDSFDSRLFLPQDAKDAKSFFIFFAVERTAKKKEHFS